MRRKFSLNVKVSRHDESALASAKPPSSHHRSVSKDSIPSLDSPYISRRRLDPKTEQELRVACAIILRNFKPSDADFADADPRLDFSGPHKPQPRTRSKPAPPDYRSSQSKQKHVKSPPRSATVRTDIDSDDGRSFGTPHTASTDNHPNGSTAPTSVAVISGKSSKRTSHQYETPAAIADAQAAEWMRQQLEKHRQQQAPQTRPETSHRPPSRAVSIKAGIKEYMFPGSTTLSRSQSRDSMRTTDSQSSSQPKRSGSSHGWRSWGLQRRSSSRTSHTSSRPGTASGRNERSEHERKPELNLNRELPPLPSLDTYVEPKPKPKVQPQGAHIATVMRSQDQRQEYAAAVRRHHRKSGSDSMAHRYAQAQAHGHGSVQTPLRSPVHQAPEKMRTPPPAALSPKALEYDHILSSMSQNRNPDERLALRPEDDPAYAMQRSPGAASFLHSSKMSFEGRSPAPNFSRKYSSEIPSSARPVTSALPYKTEVHISSPSAKPESKSKLRRALSGWRLRKEKRDDWMGQVEKQGVKNGVMLQEAPALPPVVRY